MFNPEAFIAEARRWIGTPYHHQAARRRVGCDCIGLIKGVAAATGTCPELLEAIPADYARTPDGVSLNAWLQGHMIQVPLGEAQAGDILVFRTLRHDHHVGIYTGSSLIHTGSDHGVVEHPLSERFWRQCSSCWRFPCS